MTELIPGFDHPYTPKLLWRLMLESLAEPHTTISHTKMPTWEEHLAFLEQRVWRELMLIAGETIIGKEIVGYISLTKQNEIGIRILKDKRGRHYGTEAVVLLLERFKPLPGVPSVRAGSFVANVNPKNKASLGLFEGLGFTPLQITLTQGGALERPGLSTVRDRTCTPKP